MFLRAPRPQSPPRRCCKNHIHRSRVHRRTSKSLYGGKNLFVYGAVLKVRTHLPTAVSRRTIGSSANQVAEHHRELPPLRGIGASAGSGFLTRRRLPRCSSPCKPRQGFELAPAMSIRPPRRSGGQTTRPRKPNRISRGTGSSNPVPSSRESTNFRFLRRAIAREEARRSGSGSGITTPQATTCSSTRRLLTERFHLFCGLLVLVRL